MTDQTPGRELSGDPNQPYEESDLIQIIRQKAKDWRETRKGWVEEAKMCRAAVAGGGLKEDGDREGGQWSDADKQILKDQQRPIVEFNRVGPVVDVVAGLEVTNRQEIRYIPREEGDGGVNEVLTGAAQWIRDECNAEDEESEAFVDMAITGESWTETRLDYEYDKDGMITIERVDGMEMIPDAASTKKNYRDAEGLIREKMVPLDWALDTWPDKAEDIKAQRFAEQDGDFEGESVHRNVVGDQYQAPGGPGTNQSNDKQVKLTEYQFKKREPFYRIQDPMTGQTTELSEQQYKMLAERASKIGMPFRAVRQTKCVYWRAFAIGEVLLECKHCPDPNSFTYKAMTAKRDAANKRWYGIVRGMIDPQRWANKWLSQTLDILNSNAKGGLMIEEDAIPQQGKLSDIESKWANPRAVVQFASGALASQKVQQRKPPQFPSELGQLMQFAISSIRDVSGVSIELLGMAEREQPASLEYQRKQAGITILATLFDALRKYRKEQGKSLLYLIQTYISDGRLVRIVGENGAKYVPLTNQPGIEKYDVIIDESPSSPNMKEKTWMVLQSILPIAVKMGINLPPEIVDYLPLPQSLLDKLKKPNPEREQEAMLQKQMQMEAATAEIDKTKAEAQKAQAEAMAKLVDAKIKRSEIEGQQVQLQNQLVVETTVAQRKAEIEEMKAVHAARLKAWEAEQQAALEERKASFQAGLQAKAAEGDMDLARKKLEGEQELKGLPPLREVAGEVKQQISALAQKYDALKEKVEEPVEVEIVFDPKTGRVAGSRSATAEIEIIRDVDGRPRGMKRKRREVA